MTVYGFLYRWLTFRDTGVGAMRQAALETATFFGSHHDHRSAESVRFEQLRNATCGARAFLGHHELLSPPFLELIPEICIVEPDRLGMSLPVMLAGERIAETAARELKDNDFLTLMREDVRPHAYRTCLEVIGRPCGLWGRMVAELTSGAPAEFEITGFPVIDESRDACQIAFLFRYVPTKLEPARYVSGITGGIESGWIDLGHGVPETSAGVFI